MAYPIRIEKNIALYISDLGYPLRYEVKMRISPELERMRSCKTLERAQELKAIWAAERESLKVQKSEPINSDITRQWGYL